MSNFLAIAAVTATLRNVLQAAVNVASPSLSATVATLNPADKKSTSPYVNIFLYHVTSNPGLRNVDVPTRTTTGGAVQRPQAALNLHYLISCVADDSLFGSQRLLGTVVSTLQSQPMLTRDLVTQSLNTVGGDPSLAFIKQSDLASAVDLVKLTPEHLSTEEMSKIWSVLFQIPYVLSVSYVASVVLIEATVSPATPLPVTSRGVYSLAGLRPVVDSVIVQSDELLAAYASPSPIVAGSTLYVRGTSLSGDDVHVLFGDVDVTIPTGNNTGSKIAVTLPGLAAGVTGVQVVQRIAMGTPPTAHRGTESNVFPIVIHPQITAPAAKANVVTTTVNSVDFNAADITVTLDPSVGVSQRVSLLLNQLVAAPAPPANAYTFNADARVPGVDPPTSATIAFAIKGVISGTYMVRVLVDGAESVPVGGMSNPYPQLVLP